VNLNTNPNFIVLYTMEFYLSLLNFWDNIEQILQNIESNHASIYKDWNKLKNYILLDKWFLSWYHYSIIYFLFILFWLQKLIPHDNDKYKKFVKLLWRNDPIKKRTTYK